MSFDHVAVKRGRKSDESVAAIVDMLTRYRVGDSFFVAGVQRQDMEFLRKPALAKGIDISIVRVDQDEIYAVPGVRVFRQEGEYDQL